MSVSYYGDLSGESSSDESEGSSDDDESSYSALEGIIGRGGGGAQHQTRITPHDTVRLSPSFTTNQNHTRMSFSQDDPSSRRSSEKNIPPPLEDLWSRCILHLDIDCFYCQCEEIDRKLEHPRRPLAIGQKHIIVTCNYEARRYGVKKLQSRESAMAACAHLLIVEGSDLLRYKRHSRKVYEAFRVALEEIATETDGISIIPAKKGCMDEMTADLTEIVNHMLQEGIIPDEDIPLMVPTADNKKYDDYRNHYRSDFVYGDSNAPVTLVEDQTGQTITITSSSSSTTISPSSSSSDSNNLDRILPPSRRNVHDVYHADDTELEQQLCSQRLHMAGRLVARVCKRIVQETGFYTTGGISVSPLLAKLASDLNKPKSINLLYPWRSSSLLYSMPLRKLHGLGRQTMKALDPCLSSILSKNDSDVKTVLDLLQVPDTSIARCLQSLHAYQESGSKEQCELLIQRCRGLDVSEVVDDQGGLPKTVSIENSFRRNTVTTQARVQKGLDDLLHRLPFLLNDRTSWARDPGNAYPTTIRVTVRLVDPNLVVSRQDGTTITEAQRRKGRRPYVTTSRQSSLSNGKALVLATDDTDQQSRMLKKWVEPLLEQLLSKSIKTNTINLTRLNIALANFQDTVHTTTTRNEPSTTTASHQGVSLSQSFFGSNDLSASKRANSSTSIVGWTTPNSKRPKTETFSGSKRNIGIWSTGTQTPSSLSSKWLTPPTPVQTQHHKSSFTSMKPKSNRMKATTIDNFFYRKPK